MENLHRVFSTFIFTYGAQHGDITAENRCMAGEVRRRTAEPSAFVKQIPQHFAAGKDAWRFRNHGAGWRMMPVTRKSETRY